jgi:type I restriction enzyme S subunit
MICVSESELEIILDILRKYVPDCEVRAFGSRYKWTSKEYSDLDIAIVGKEKMPPRLLGGIRDAFEESDLPYRVDVLDWLALTPEFQAIIEQGYEVIYGPKTNGKKHWPRVRLGDICDYYVGRILTKSLTVNNYISTENILPNKSGITISSGLPITEFVPGYQKGTILVSNIRPYFKKIWHTTQDGGCSNDVLVFKAKNDYYPKFLYYLLSEDKFFDYATATSKGTKMPRGDKTAIMRYFVPDIPYNTQRAIAATLSCLDDKIELNNRINANLEAQAQAIWSKQFGGHEPNGVLGDILELFDFKRVPLSGNQRDKMEKIYPYYGAAALMDYVDDYLFDGIYLLLGEDGTVINDLGFPTLQYVWGKFWVNNHAHIIQGQNGFMVESLYILLKQTNVTPIVTGAVQPKINQANLKAFAVFIPTIEEIECFNTLISPLFAQIRQNTDENRTLAAIRDTLLPRLMSGEIEAGE